MGSGLKLFTDHFRARNSPYTADDERILEYRIGGGAFRTSLRDLNGKILREYRLEAAANWSSFEDYIYRDSTLLASVHPTEGTSWFGPDHLGTPRAVFNSAGSVIGLHTYYPFGEEATAATQDTQQTKFTGHERDLLNTPTGVADDTDFMHARQFSIQTGRFHSFDPVGGNPRRPQSWNRFAYVLGNSLKYTDPTGLEPVCWQDKAGNIHCTDDIPAGNNHADPDPTDFVDVFQPPSDLGDREQHGDGRENRCIPVSGGVSIDLSTINPFSSGFGGTYGFNFQFVPGAGFGIYGFGSDNDSDSAGFDVGLSATVNIAIGGGAWEGGFLNAVGSVGPWTAGGFGSPHQEVGTSPQQGPGCHGVQGGVTGGFQLGAGTTVTNYRLLLPLGGSRLGCSN